MLFSDFASAAVLISFGVVLGKASPLQLIVMALIEIVLFFVNEVLGRKYLGVSNWIQLLLMMNGIKGTKITFIVL